jgi:glucan phosphoethanolaminetransferase (alkaline phosphatase superfamily)
MIQRVQTLLWLEIAFLSISLLFVPVQTIILAAGEAQVHLMPLKEVGLSSTMGHMAAVILNFLAIVICFLCIFNFKKRELQIKLSWALIVIFLVLIGMIAFCPFVSKNDIVKETRTNVFGYFIPAVAIISSFIAIRFVKKDIELLKSADRIR